MKVAKTNRDKPIRKKDRLKHPDLSRIYAKSSEQEYPSTSRVERQESPNRNKPIWAPGAEDKLLAVLVDVRTRRAKFARFTHL